MAIILSQITVGDHRIMVVDSAPNVGSGLSAPIGSMLIVEGQDAVWLKTGSNNTDWKISTVDKEALFQRLDNIESDIDAEESRALAAESALQDAIDAEVLARQDAIQGLQDQVSAIDAVNDQDLLDEVSRAQAAEALLQSNIDSEALTRQSSDNALQDAIDAEVLARQSADQELDARLDLIESSKEIIESDNLLSFPEIGEVSKVYVAKDSNKIYRFDSQTSEMSFDFTVGSGGDFADLQSALASVSVLNGHKLKVLNGSYLVSSVINVTKEVTIVGESKEGVIFQTAGTTSDPVNMMSVSANNVSLANMTFKHKKTSNTSVETVISASGTVFPQTRVSNFVAENLHIEFCEFGMVVRGQDWTIRGCRFVYATGSVSNSARAVGIYGNKGTSFLYQNILDNSVLNGTAFRPFYLTSTTGSNPSETVEGSLYVEGTTQVGANLAQFFNMDNNQSTGAGTFNLIIKDNVISESNLFAGFSSAVENAGDMFAQVVLSGNTLSNLHAVDGGKGIFGVYGTASFRTSPLPVHASNNTLGQEVYRTGWMAVEGSIVGKETGTPAFSVALDSVIPDTPSVPSVPTQSIVQEYVELSPTDPAVQSKLDELESELAQEVLDRQSGDASTLASAQVYTDQKVADLVNSAPEVLDTLKELSDALGGDENFAATVAGQIGAVDDRVDQEILDRQSADNALQSAIDDEETRALAAEAALQSDIDSEELARISGDQQLQLDIDAEEARALLAESGLQSQITQEISDRQADVDAEESRALLAEAALQTSIDNINSDLSDLDGYAQDIRSDLDQEVLDRTAADSALDARIDVLEADPVTKTYVDAADNSLQGQISQEILDRQSGDASTLSSAQSYADQKIADLVNSAPAVLDTLKELSDALGGDANFAATIAGQLGDLDDKIDQEILDRVADVDAEQARAEAAEALKLNKAGDTMSGDLNMGSNDVIAVDKLGLGSSAPETKFHLEENNVKFNISAHSVSTSGAVNAVVASISPALDSVELFKVMITGIDSSSKDSVSYERTVRVKNIGGTLGLGTIQSDYTSEDISMTDANCTFIVNASNVDVRVTGIDSKDITWKCVINRMR